MLNINNLRNKSLIVKDVKDKKECVETKIKDLSTLIREDFRKSKPKKNVTRHNYPA